MAPRGISAGLARAVDGLGGGSFHRLLLDALTPLLPWSYRYVFVYRRDGPPLIPYFEGIDRSWIDRYLAGYFRFDPFYRLCLSSSPEGVLLLRDHMPPGGSGFRYDAFLHDIDVIDDVVLMLPDGAGATVALTWDRSGERFPAEALDALREASPLALALQRAHRERTGAQAVPLATAAAPPGPLSFEETVAGFLPEALTPRERDIVRLALNGFDNAAIARRLGIGDQVVRNRKRGIYDKLDITSERELFRLFLDHVMGDVTPM